MKIKGKFIIPLIAVLIAMFTIGITPGAAADTTTTVYDSLTYVPPTIPPTSSLEEEVEGIVSDVLGDDLQNAEGPLRGFSEIMGSLLNSIRNAINAIISFFQGVGGMIGNSSFGSGMGLGGF